MRPRYAKRRQGADSSTAPARQEAVDERDRNKGLKRWYAPSSHRRAAVACRRGGQIGQGVSLPMDLLDAEHRHQGLFVLASSCPSSR